MYQFLTGIFRIAKTRRYLWNFQTLKNVEYLKRYQRFKTQCEFHLLSFDETLLKWCWLKRFCICWAYVNEKFFFFHSWTNISKQVFSLRLHVSEILKGVYFFIGVNNYCFIGYITFQICKCLLHNIKLWI